MRSRGIALAMAVWITGVSAGAMAQTPETPLDPDFVFRRPLPLDLPRRDSLSPDHRPYGGSAVNSDMPHSNAYRARIGDITGYYPWHESSRESATPMKPRQPGAGYYAAEFMASMLAGYAKQQKDVNPITGKSMRPRR